MSLSTITSTAATLKPLVYSRAELESTFLPVNQMLQIDRVTEINQQYIVCEMDLAGHWVFPMHFPADPIFPGTLLIEAAGQVIAIWAWNAGIRGRPRLVKVGARFESCVLPEDGFVKLTATVRRRKRVCTGVVEIFALGRKVAEVEPMIIVVSPLEPGLNGCDSPSHTPDI